MEKMNSYKDTCFDAIMWSQGVQNLLRDCTLKAVANGRITPSDKTLEKIKNTMGLAQLAREIESCISDNLHTKLISFSKDRNRLAHDAADRYMKTLISGASDNAIGTEIWKFNENKRAAGELYGELLKLHSKFYT